MSYTDTRSITTAAASTALATLETAVVAARNKSNHSEVEKLMTHLNEVARLLRVLHL